MLLEAPEITRKAAIPRFHSLTKKLKVFNSLRKILRLTYPDISQIAKF